MTDPWSGDFDDLRVFSLAMQNKLELSVCLSDKGKLALKGFIYVCDKVQNGVTY